MTTSNWEFVGTGTEQLFWRAVSDDDIDDAAVSRLPPRLLFKHMDVEDLRDTAHLFEQTDKPRTTP